MIDVLFGLLVCCMSSARALTINGGVLVHLSTAVPLPKATREQHRHLTVGQDEMMVLTEQPMTVQALGPRVHAVMAADPQHTVVRHTAGPVRHRTVVDILDALRLAGRSGLTVAVKAGKKRVG